MHRLVAGCALTALGLNVAINLCFASPSAPTLAPLVALVAQNSALPLLLVGAYVTSGATRAPLAPLAPLASKEAPLLGQADTVAAVPSRSEVFGAPLWAQLRIAIAAMLWTCAELWAWELQVFEASALGPGNAAAYTLLSSTCAAQAPPRHYHALTTLTTPLPRPYHALTTLLPRSYRPQALAHSACPSHCSPSHLHPPPPSSYSLLICVFPVSCAGAASALIGEALGRRDEQRAAVMLRTVCVLVLLMVVSYGAVLLPLRAELARLLGGGVAAVEAAYVRTLPVILAMHLLDAPFNVFKAWLTVRKKQVFGAVMTVVVYYLFGVPLGAWLAWRAGWGLVGLWLGLGAAVLLGCIAASGQVAMDVARLLGSEADALEESSEDSAGYVYLREAGGSSGADRPLAGGTSGGGLRGGGGGPEAWRRCYRSAASTRSCYLAAPLLGLLLPGAAGLMLCIGWEASSPSAPTPTPSAPPLPPLGVGSPALLQGSAPCLWSTGGAFYRYPFSATFDPRNGVYSWRVAIADRSNATATGMAAALPDAVPSPSALGDDAPIAVPFDSRLEVGWAVWLRPPEIRLETGGHGAWTSRAFVGTRVSSAEHTFCGCQFMRGDEAAFRLTEHGRAQLPFASTVPGAPWYLNATRRQIEAEIVSTCALYAHECPQDNATAYAEWASSSKLTEWVVPPWVEVYGSLPV